MSALKTGSNKELDQAIQHYHSILTLAKANRSPIKNKSVKCKQAVNDYEKLAFDLEDFSDNLALCSVDYKNCSDLELDAHLLGACAGNNNYDEDCFVEYGIVQMESASCPQCSLTSDLVIYVYGDFEDAYRAVQSYCF
ncbi:MAG: hypothetical protein O3C63_03765 [Cyanobacteria bacterium]|nr:hypothetical protein [Cyanobacteriota bacterium]